MPSVSGKQARAMQAAAHGASKIGIPKKVGEEFAAADKHEPPGAEKTEKVKKPKKAPPVRGGPFSLRR